jgi:hypothetical protein
MSRISRINGLLVILLVYCSASLFHFVHNAVYIEEYPNLPAWITVAGIYVTWLGITAIGIVGYLLVRHEYQLIGLLTVGVYGALGLDGLAHYHLAPVSAHSFTMNLSIWSEAVTAVAVVIAVTVMLINHFKNRSERALN